MSNKFTLPLCLLLLLALPFEINAQTPPEKELPQFQFPVACDLGVNCWTVNYVDMDPSDKVSDFTCGPRSYDAHKGTDFALKHIGDIRRGVNVLAPMDGEVLRMRDGESDTLKTPEELEEISKNNKDCGNGMLIDHGDAGFQGLQTIYCHLRAGSITVKPGDKVKAGEAIGQVGQSGVAEFPHLHFGVTWEGGVIDPYSGIVNTKGCGQFKHTLWHEDVQDKLTYSPLAIYDGGFDNKVPDFDAIKRGEHENASININNSSDAILFWAAFYGLKEGDEVILDVRGPTGESVLNRTTIQDKTRARQFYYTGRRLNNLTLEPGRYDGTITVKREGLEPQSKTHSIVITQ